MWVETGEPPPDPVPEPLECVETGVPVLDDELEPEPLVPVEIGALALGAVLDDPLVPLVTGATAAVELAAPLVPLVAGAGAGAGAGAAAAAGAGVGAGEADPAGLTFGAG